MPGKTLVIIPAYNEEKNLGKVLTGIQCMHPDLDILVINDGSRDKTEEVARLHNAKVISLPFNLGYGNALQTGFKYADFEGYEYIVQFDADGQHRPEYIRAILDELVDGEQDVVIGSRFTNGGLLNQGILKAGAVLFFRFLIRVSTGEKITDPTSGLIGLTRRVFSHYSKMGNFPEDYPDADMLIQMMKKKYRVCEIPVNMSERETGKSMHSGLKPVYYFFKVMLSIFIVLLSGNKNY